MATPPKPWRAEYAKSGRSSCKTCKSVIDKDQLRLGKMVTAKQFDGFMPMWNHASCVLKKAKQIKSFDDVEGIDLLRWEDQQKIRKYVEDGSMQTTSTGTAIADSECAIEVSQTSRATCKRCNEKIIKGTVRISTKPEGQGARGVAWHHVHCFIQMSPSVNVEKVSGWDNLPSEEKAAVSSCVKKDSSTTKREDTGKEEKAAASEQTKGAKRKTDGNDEQKTKVSKSNEDVLAGGSSSSGKAVDLESKLKEQTNALWEIKDGLKKNVTTAMLRQMLEANDQDSGGSDNDLRERCADGMLFGALGKCPICSGSLRYSDGQYYCNGYVSAWSKCSYSTAEPVRLKKKWIIPEGTENEYLLKWSKSQKAKKPDRVLPPVSSKSLVRQISPVKSQTYYSERLDDLKIAISGDMEDWKRKLVEAGGRVHSKITKDTSCLVLCEGAANSDSEIRKARRMKIPIVRDEYLGECIKKRKKLPFDLYKVEAANETLKNDTVTVKVKGRSAVHEASGLQDTGHILEDGNSIYNTTLNMSDLVTGVNSYYILQIIQEDKGSDCYVFRKWGRVGSDKIGGFKLDAMSKYDAIEEFKRLFREKTGNPWEAWEKKHNFQKHPGKFFPLDIDYGVPRVPRKKDPSKMKSLLAPQLTELMKMLFNVETYRAAMLEFEINMSEMPLGKLSKMNIQKGFEVLTEIQNILNDTAKSDPAVRESLIVDASNRFFTLIPSIHPHVIRDEDDFNKKVKMLEALQDIEIASRLVNFDSEDDESLDEKYKKLHCNIAPLPHGSEDYRLIEKYLLNTHAPTHKEWSLELEEVFSLEREGEFDKYAPHRDKLKNKMLLWHGSRLTNFVGILSQGLRIAPPEAPATGYMFGKGIYFADLVSKSAQYCFVDRNDPVGLMLLSEVALGEIHELKKATYMDKPPRGKHSTKGLGKTVPLESEFEKWRDVIVPCGKPVPSNIRGSELLYNEYIVYNTAQVKMQFLLKVRFHHKRQ
ncbi:poly [ADP-ribose] polymerase 1 isoform X2 [Asparagus officinalis]|uniref:poly [ADP-ribose] polymerase 1 isoform X2 n=1 Tax=Asparagus officinalis TaxID=4686 RepID=UPI00098E0DF4|nr:poly [ADP-ribose] polymerase 1 isoform X2 [Asparagus officinalis]